MTMQDPIADMLTRIRNAQQSKHKTVSFGNSKIKKAILSVLKEEGYIENYYAREIKGLSKLVVDLKYFEGRPVIETLDRISKSSLRVYKKADELKTDFKTLLIVSTSKGVKSHKKALAANLGGEVLAKVS
jgi:small subunit ribosomal protein S8